ncbi:hypothetical protein Q8G50_31590, partial [Klebsiella pneumoniae]
KRGLADLQQAKLKQDSILTHSAREKDKENAREKLQRYNQWMPAIRHVYGDSTSRKFDDEELDLAVIQDLSDSLQRGDLPQAVRTSLAKK